MTDLTNLPPSKPPERPITLALRPELRQLLECDGTDEAAAQAIAREPALVADLRFNMRALEQRATGKAGQAGVREVVGRRFATYPQPERSPGEWAAWWADYFDVLEGVTLAALEAGMRAYIREGSSEFMPKPGKLLELARTTPSNAMRAYGRAKRVEALLAPRPEAPRLTGEQQATIDELMASYHAKFAERPTPSRPTMPVSHGKPDERGITPALRELMANREQDAR